MSDQASNNELKDAKVKVSNTNRLAGALILITGIWLYTQSPQQNVWLFLAFGLIGGYLLTRRR